MAAKKVTRKTSKSSKKVSRARPSSSKEKGQPLSHSTRWLLFVVCCLLIVLFGGIIVYSLLFVAQPIDVLIVPYDVAIGDVVGFDVEGDTLHFGQVMGFGRMYRDMTLQNGFTSVVHMEAHGDFSEGVEFSENDFVLPQGESKTVTVYLGVPPGHEFGNYTGEVKIYFYPVS